jgi:hypothetical protein
MNHHQRLLRTALSLAARGWHVFPGVPGGKSPALRENWKQLATTDPARIGRWWRHRPYNICIACGPSGLVVLDLDVAGHGQADGDDCGTLATGAEELARICQEHGEPFPGGTFAVQTPSGGQHFYFTAPDIRILNSAGRIGPLIDVRSDGGYVVAPGSRSGGKRYEITSPMPPVALPMWLAKLAQAPEQRAAAADRHPAIGISCGGAYANAALRNEAENVASAPEGTRHDTLNRAAFNLGQLIAEGLLAAGDVAGTLAEAATAVGLKPTETRRIIRSGMDAGHLNPRRPRTHARQS